MSAASSFAGVTATVDFGAASFTEEEKQELLDILEKNTALKIQNNQTKLCTERQPHPAAAPDGTTPQPLSMTEFHRGNVRSGQSLSFPGSAVILGDVNPGAMVKAAGSIIVLGSLRGGAHAGCEGAKEAFIAASYFNTASIRIADKALEKPLIQPAAEKAGPEYAFIKNDSLMIEPLSQTKQL